MYPVFRVYGEIQNHQEENMNAGWGSGALILLGLKLVLQRPATLKKSQQQKKNHPIKLISFHR